MIKVYCVWVDYDEFKFKLFSTKEKAEEFNLKKAKKEYDKMTHYIGVNSKGIPQNYKDKYFLKEFMKISRFEVKEVKIE